MTIERARGTWRTRGDGKEPSRNERFQQHPSPLKVARLAYGYTQNELATTIGCSRQVIIDTENGCVMNPNPRLISYLCQYDTTLSERLTEAFYAWRSERRRDQDDPLGPQRLVEALQTAAEPPTTFAAVITLTTNSTRGFSRMLILQTSLVKDYISKGYNWNQIRIALLESGLSPTLVEWLHNLPRTETQRELRDRQPT